LVEQDYDDAAIAVPDDVRAPYEGTDRRTGKLRGDVSLLAIRQLQAHLRRPGRMVPRRTTEQLFHLGQGHPRPNLFMVLVSNRITIPRPKDRKGNRCERSQQQNIEPKIAPSPGHVGTSAARLMNVSSKLISFSFT